MRTPRARIRDPSRKRIAQPDRPQNGCAPSAAGGQGARGVVCRPRMIQYGVPMSKFVAWVVMGALVAGPAARTAFAEQPLTITPSSPAQIRLSFAPVVKKVRPAVVNVYASRVERTPDNPLLDDPVFKHFFG